MINLYNDDCLKVLPKIKEETIDFVLTDIPYGTTNCKWDNVIPFDEMWNELKRVIFDNSCVALFGSEPFSSRLRLSNLNCYKYDWYWQKEKGFGFLNSKKQPLRNIETISCFYKKQCKYFPQMEKGKPYLKKNKPNKNKGITNEYTEPWTKSDGLRFPQHLISFKKATGLHPTQKPVALLEYLIKTYTDENDTVLDFTMGSGSTGVACKNLNRNFIGIELDTEYFNIAKKRIDEVQT